MDVSIVIVSWNTCDILRNCLRSVYEQTKEIDFEVIVVDNASNDNSVKMIKEEFPNVIVIDNLENRGFAAANNQGITFARGRYALLLNSDTIVLDNAITKTVEFADSHPEAAVVGCRVLNPDRTLQPTCFMFPSVLNMLLSSSYLYKLFPRSKFFGRERMTWWDRDDVREVDVVTGCFMLVRKEAIEQASLLDEQFFMYFEEADWCYLLKQVGWKILFMPDAEIIHIGGASGNQAKPKMIAQWTRSMMLFFKKHRSSLEYVLACILITFFYLTRIPYWLVRTVISKNMNR